MEVDEFQITMVDEFQIAMLRAELLDTTRNWAQHSTFDGSYDPRTFSGKLDPLELQSMRLETLTAKLASFRARETKRKTIRLLTIYNFFFLIGFTSLIGSTQLITSLKLV